MSMIHSTVGCKETFETNQPIPQESTFTEARSAPIALDCGITIDAYEFVKSTSDLIGAGGGVLLSRGYLRQAHAPSVGRKHIGVTK